MGVMRLERRVMCQKHDNEEAVRGKGRALSSVIHLEVGDARGILMSCLLMDLSQFPI